MRDWIHEMGAHTKSIQSAIDEDRNDDAWRLTHQFQDWCIERINAENYKLRDAGTLLSSPQGFFIKVLLKEHKYRDALVHIMYQGVLDARNLKYYPKVIKSNFRKCKYKNTNVSEAFALYEELKHEPPDFSSAFHEIRDAVSSWS